MTSLRDSLGAADMEKKSQILSEKGIPVLEGIRGMCDAVEELVSREFWPYPRYSELLVSS